VNLLPVDQVLDDMAAAVAELTGMDLVQGVVLAGLGGPEIEIDRGDPPVSGYLVDPGAARLDLGCRV